MKKIELDENTKRAVGDFYSAPHSLAETAAHFNLKSQPIVKRALADLGIQLHDKALTVSMQQRKAKKTFRAHYGCDYAISSKIVKEKAKASYIAKYGVENPFQAESVKSKAKATMLERYGETCALKNEAFKAKMMATSQAKYWKTHYNGSQAAKMRYTLKYGCDSPTKTQAFKAKRTESLRRNKTFNSSSDEEAFYIRLKSKFPDVIRQYSEERYRHACDFYIPSKDLFIELNLTWTHGGHAFDPENALDSAKLEAWKEKAENSKFYANAIDTWTRRDPEKLTEAKKNKLNYVILYSKNECDAFLAAL